ncbi:hypothetical protein JW848_10715 [Candidatus Bipolaricaulota bacterium]|nr:hypothetical protein [Candidatus Bipolaricaulota bacterium]
MSIVVECLGTAKQLLMCERTIHLVTGSTERELIPAHVLVALHRAGATILGAMNDADPNPQLLGCLVDIVSLSEHVPSRLTLFCGVVPSRRNEGVGYHLRLEERRLLLKRDVAVVRWAVDPLSGAEMRFSLNKLGAIGVRYERDLYGMLENRADRGMATDRIVMEWWLDAPRVCGLVDRRRAPHHFRLGLDSMELVTKTRLDNAGNRRLVGPIREPRGDVVMVEVPESMETLEDSVRREWRLGLRDALETLFDEHFLLSGFVHETGRSFHLLERRSRAEILEMES